jgi:hypothetical protein
MGYLSADAKGVKLYAWLSQDFDAQGANCASPALHLRFSLCLRCHSASDTVGAFLVTFLGLEFKEIVREHFSSPLLQYAAADAGKTFALVECPSARNPIVTAGLVDPRDRARRHRSAYSTS